MENFFQKKIYTEHVTRKPDFSMTCDHVHSHYEFYYLYSGTCVFSVNGTLYSLSAGDAFLVVPNDQHHTHYEGEVLCERTTVYFYNDILSSPFFSKHPELTELLSASGKIAIKKDKQPVITTILQQMCTENEQADDNTLSVLSLQLYQLLLQLKRYGIFYREQSETTLSLSEDIERVKEYIHMNYRLPITLDEVAEKANLSPTYLSKKFRRVTGVTFKEYLNYIRIRKASQALLTTDDPIAQIAADCGFNGSNYFKDIFRKTTGYSPREFRKQSKQN